MSRSTQTTPTSVAARVFPLLLQALPHRVESGLERGHELGRDARASACTEVGAQIVPELIEHHLRFAKVATGGRPLWVCLTAAARATRIRPRLSRRRREVCPQRLHRV